MKKAWKDTITLMISVLLPSFVMLCDGRASAFEGVALRGRVLDAAGSPLSRVDVSVHKLSGEQFDQVSPTNFEGKYLFKELPDGEYSVDATLPGFVSECFRPIRIVFPAQVQLNFALEVADLGEGAIYASSILVGELVWRGRRIAGAKVCLAKVDGSHQPTCTVTNGLGQYFLDVPPAVYSVEVDNGSDLRTKQQLDMRNGGEYRNKISLPDVHREAIRLALFAIYRSRVNYEPIA